MLGGIRSMKRFLRAQLNWRSKAISGGAGSYQEAVVEAKRKVVRDALERAHGVFTEAARLLNSYPNYLHRLVRSLNLQ